MKLSLLLPLALVLAAAGGLGLVQHRLRPRIAAWALTGVAVAGAAAATSVLLTMAFAFVHGVPWFGHRMLWCVHLTSTAGVATWALGAVTTGWSVMAVVRVRRRRSAYRALRAAGAQGPEVEIVAKGAPTAFSLPGRPGRIVVSESMLACLPRAEQAVLFAHELSHLSHRHDRFIHAADLASDVFPLLAPLASRVRYATERWADEDAAEAVGDRAIAARAVARAALAQNDAGPRLGLGLAGLGVLQRVEALMAGPPSGRIPAATLVATATSAIVVAASSTLQLHHLAMVAEHVCRMS